MAVLGLKKTDGLPELDSEEIAAQAARTDQVTRKEDVD